MTFDTSESPKKQVDVTTRRSAVPMRERDEARVCVCVCVCGERFQGNNEAEMDGRGRSKMQRGRRGRRGGRRRRGRGGDVERCDARREPDAYWPSPISCRFATRGLRIHE
jgi:hypothetical protein